MSRKKTDDQTDTHARVKRQLNLEWWHTRHTDTLHNISRQIAEQRKLCVEHSQRNRQKYCLTILIELIPWLDREKPRITHSVILDTRQESLIYYSILPPPPPSPSCSLTSIKWSPKNHIKRNNEKKNNKKSHAYKLVELRTCIRIWNTHTHTSADAHYRLYTWKMPHLVGGM